MQHVGWRARLGLVLLHLAAAALACSLDLSGSSPTSIDVLETFDGPLLTGWRLADGASAAGGVLRLPPGASASYAIHPASLVLTVVAERQGSGPLLIEYGAGPAGAYGLRLDAGAVSLVRRDDGGTEAPLGDPAPLATAASRPVTVEIVHSQGAHRVYVDGRIALAAQDPAPLPAGEIRLRPEGQASAAVEVVRIVSPVPAPRLVVVAPVNNSRYAAGARIVLHAAAFDWLGVDRLVFEVNSIPVGEVRAADPAGDPLLIGSVAWTVPDEQGYRITVEAFRADGASLGLRDVRIEGIRAAGVQMPPVLPTAPTEATPTAGPPTALPTNTPARGSGAPDLQGPIARADTALNVRQGPGTEYPTIRVMAAGERASIVGRNADSTWWAVTVNGVNGWIFAGLTTVEGDVSAVPVTTP